MKRRSRLKVPRLHLSRSVAIVGERVRVGDTRRSQAFVTESSSSSSLSFGGSGHLVVRAHSTTSSLPIDTASRKVLYPTGIHLSRAHFRISGVLSRYILHNVLAPLFDDYQSDRCFGSQRAGPRGRPTWEGKRYKYEVWICGSAVTLVITQR